MKMNNIEVKKNINIFNERGGLNGNHHIFIGNKQQQSNNFMAPEKQIPPGAAPSFGGSFIKGKVPKIFKKKQACQLISFFKIEVLDYIHLSD